MEHEPGREKELVIDQGELLRLRNPAGRHIAVKSGAVWITQEGDRRDILVERGEQFRFDRDRLALVLPLYGAASVQIELGLIPERDAGTGPAYAAHRVRIAHTPQFEREAKRMRAQAISEGVSALAQAVARVTRRAWGFLGAAAPRGTT